ncbi:MAG: VCBS domain-containing protein [Vulcanococcus sp.]
MYHFSLDVSGRTGTNSPDDAAVEVLWEGKVIDTIRPAVNTFGMVRHEYDLTAHTDHPRIEFRALDHSGSGPLVDNPNFQFRGFRGTEDTPLSIKLGVESPDKDGSEILGAAMKGLPAGFELSDGTPGHHFTSTGVTKAIDMQGWDLQHIQVIPTPNFHGTVDAVLIATATESSNHDQSSTQIPVPLVFDAVNDLPTVQITAGAALSEGSTNSSTSQITGSDVDGDTTSVDKTWLTSHGWSTADSGVTYTKAGTYGTATLTTATATVSYQLNNATGGATDRLAQGQHEQDRFEVQISDGHSGTASGTAVFNVTGTNDAPTVTASTVSPVVEGSGATATSILTMRDPDSNDPSPTIDTQWLASNGWATADGGATYTKAGTYGSATLTVMSGTVSYQLNNAPGAAADQLHAGDSARDQFQVQVVDAHGATGATQVGFEITGSNDAPVLNAIPRQTATEDGSTVTGQLSATDVDSGDSLTYGVVAGTQLPPGLTILSNGHWTFDPTNAAYNSLGTGQTQQVIAHLQVSDGHGGTSQQTLTIDLTGSNDGPVLSALARQTATEGGAAVTGQLRGTDVDSGDTLNYSVATGETLPAGLSLQPNGQWTFDPTDPAYNSLGAGQTQQVIAHLQVSDGHGGTSQQTLTIDVTGTNDAPTVSQTAVHLASATEGKDGVQTPVTYTEQELLQLIGARDSDSGDALHITAISAPSGFGSFTKLSNGDWQFNPPADQHQAGLAVSITVEDSQHQSTTAHALLDVLSATDSAVASLVVTSAAQVMQFDSPGQHAYMYTGSGPLSAFSLEVMAVGDPANKGSTTSDTGQVLFNLATASDPNVLSIWRPAALSIAFGGSDHATNPPLDITTGQHRLTLTWDKTSGEMTLYDNGKVYQHWQNINTGQDIPAGTIVTVGQKMNTPTSHSGFNADEQFHGDLFNVTMANQKVGPTDVQVPLANHLSSAQLLLDIRQDSGGVHNTMIHPSSGNLWVTNIGTATMQVSTTASAPQAGALLNLNLVATPPADHSDTISRELLRGLPPGTVISDGAGHSHTVPASGEVNVLTDLPGWQHLDQLTAQLPSGYHQNTPLQLVVETTGPDGSLSRASSDASVLFDPSAPLTPLPALATASPPPPPPPPPAPAMSDAPSDDAMDTPTVTLNLDGDAHHHPGATAQAGDHNLAAEQATPAPSHQDLQTSSHEPVPTPTLSAEDLHLAVQSLLHPQGADSLGLSTDDHATPAALDPLAPPDSSAADLSPDLNPDLLAHAADHLASTASTAPDADPAKPLDTDQIPLATEPDPVLAGNAGGGLMPADVDIAPPTPPADPIDNDPNRQDSLGA